MNEIANRLWQARLDGTVVATDDVVMPASDDGGRLGGSRLGRPEYPVLAAVHALAPIDRRTRRPIRLLSVVIRPTHTQHFLPLRRSDLYADIAGPFH